MRPHTTGLPWSAPQHPAFRALSRTVPSKLLQLMKTLKKILKKKEKADYGIYKKVPRPNSSRLLARALQSPPLPPRGDGTAPHPHPRPRTLLSLR